MLCLPPASESAFQTITLFKAFPNYPDEINLFRPLIVTFAHLFQQTIVSLLSQFHAFSPEMTSHHVWMVHNGCAVYI